MPIKKCITNGKKGYKFGNKGKCYSDKDAIKKAKRQGKAIKANS